MEPSVIFPSFVMAVFAVWAAYTLYSYAAIGTRKRVLFVSYLGFLVSFGCVVLISFDIDNTLANRHRDFLYYAWRVMYWLLQSLSWVVFPFNMEKERTGSWRKSLQRNAIWWGVYAFVGLVAVIYFLGVTNIGFRGMIAFAYAASNSFGMLLIILFAGYGLVSAPQWFFLKSKPREYLEHLYIKAVALEDSRLSAKYDLQDIFNESRKSMDLNDPDMIAASSFLSSEYGLSTSNGESRPGRDPVTKEQDKVTELRDALQTAKRAINSWKMLLRECFTWEDVQVETSLSSYLHQSYLVWMKVLGVGSGLLSFLIILGQSTIFIDVWWLSIIAIGFRKGVWENPQVLENGWASFFIQALITIPPLWIFYCCFWSLTRLKLARFYGLYPNHNTDTVSQMWCGGMLIRIAFPLVYNYLFVLRIPDHPATVFEEMQGLMNVVPLLGESFAEYFPLLILVVGLLTLSNTYAKVLNFLGLGSVLYDSPDDPKGRAKLIEDGRKIIARERQARAEVETGTTRIVGKGYAELPN
jgi:hypothetical protein